MYGARKIGKVGPLTVYLSYTWIFAAVLTIWWVALIRLPEQYPTWSRGFYWLAAIAVVLLFIGSVILHELVHSAVAHSGPRNVNLFPFGAAVPFRFRDTSPGRLMLAALAGALFNLLLGGVLIIAGTAIQDAPSAINWIGGVIVPLGWLNLLLGLFNFIPGIPFDGGWVAAGAVYSYTNDRDSSLGFSQAVGRIASLVLVFAGAWLGLATESWIPAIALVLLGWAAREAGAVGLQRRVLRDMLSQMDAREFMDPTRPGDAVHEDDTVSRLVAAHRGFPPDTPIPVLDSTDNLVGVTTLNSAEQLLQGTWASTPVRSITVPVSELHAVEPSTNLVDVLAVARSHASSQPDDADEKDEAIPVIEGSRLIGSIKQNKLWAFLNVESQFGGEEAVSVDEGPKKRGLLWRLGSLLPYAFLLAMMAILGNIALRTDPGELQDAVAGDSGMITFSNFNPADGDIIGLGGQQISVQIEGASPVISASMTLDGDALNTTLTGTSPLTQTATANVAGLLLGQHTARIVAVTDDGSRKSMQWHFRVSSTAPPPDQASPTPGATGAAPIKLLGYQPELGRRIPAGQDVNIQVDLTAAAAPSEVRISLDGQALDTAIKAVDETEGAYQATASAPQVAPGRHRVRAEVIGSAGGTAVSEWTFTAVQPDAANVYFDQTGYFVSEPFLSYWQQNGGLALFGYPISEQLIEKDQASGEEYTAQYFERARFEHHSSGASVVLGALGTILHGAEPPAQPKEGAQFFSETGHNLSGPFLDYWTGNGGLAQFGYPITEERTETSPTDGKQYLVQYFERNRFELHPGEAGAPDEVQLGLLGTRLYNDKYGK